MVFAVTQNHEFLFEKLYCVNVVIMSIKILGTSGSVVISVHIFILVMLKTRVLFMDASESASRIDFRASRTLSAGGAISHHPSLTRVVVMSYLSPSSRWSRRLSLQSIN
ncbi:MAG: hypothetical protein ABS892_03940, partial [Psychrobacillus sp.]